MELSKKEGEFAEVQKDLEQLRADMQETKNSVVDLNETIPTQQNSMLELHKKTEQIDSNAFSEVRQQVAQLMTDFTKSQEMITSFNNNAEVQHKLLNELQ